MRGTAGLAWLARIPPQIASSSLDASLEFLLFNGRSDLGGGGHLGEKEGGRGQHCHNGGAPNDWDVVEVDPQNCMAYSI